MASGNPDFQPALLPSHAEVEWTEDPLQTGDSLRFKSPWTGSQQRLRRWGAWRFRFEWDLLDADQALPIIAKLNSYSEHTTFSVYDPARPLPRGDATVADMVNLKVDGPGQTGRSLLLKDGPDGAAVLCLKAGDLFGISSTGEMYEVAADFETTGTPGAGTITFNQYIRTSPNDEDPVVVSYVPCRVWGKGPAESQVTPPVIYTIDWEGLENTVGGT